jgi:hypothetical protein
MPVLLEALVIVAALVAPALWFGRPSRRPHVPAPGPRWTVEGLDRRTRTWEVIDTAWTPEDVQAVMVDAMAARRHALLRVVDSEVAA